MRVHWPMTPNAELCGARTIFVPSLRTMACLSVATAIHVPGHRVAQFEQQVILLVEPLVDVGDQFVVGHIVIPFTALWPRCC